MFVSSESPRRGVPKQIKEWTTKCVTQNIFWTCTRVCIARPLPKKTPGDNWVSSSVLHCLFKRPTLKVYQTLRQLATHVLHTHIAQSISQVFSPQPLSGKIPGFWSKTNEERAAWRFNFLALSVPMSPAHDGLRFDNGGHLLTKIVSKKHASSFFTENWVQVMRKDFLHQLGVCLQIK